LRKWARMRAVSPLHDPETRKELLDLRGLHLHR
jgi:hypothetical protein